MKKSIVRLLAIGMLLGGAVVPATVANDGLLSPVTTTQTAKAATADKEQTIDFDVLKTGTDNASISSQYFNKTAKITPNSDGTYKVTIQVSIPTIASVNILTMGGQKVSDSDKYKTDSGTYQDISFNINDVSDLKNPLNSSMKIQVMGLGLMNQTADFKFDMNTLKEVKSDDSDSSKDETPTDTEKDPEPEPDTNKDDQDVDIDDYDDELNPTQIGEDTDELVPQQIGEDSNSSEDGTKVVVGDPVKIATTHYDDLKDAQTIDFSVLKTGTTDPSIQHNILYKLLKLQRTMTVLTE
ncbi:NEAT domain-containing protein [Companilactobacillus furfuricola]|uniref:NEAT domain-containing protein n=1 Tax=Companilactobacillus furfuricola TaxID=1462575 RepID=UPI000F79C173|nr:NEAT domain-containing protein [Companilactobacillus furfuricola]